MATFDDEAGARLRELRALLASSERQRDSIVSANWALRERFQRLPARELQPPLCTALAALADGPLVEVDGAIALSQLVGGQTPRPEPADRTAWEASASKIHVEDYTSAKDVDALAWQGFLYAERLAARLSSLGKPARVVLGVDAEWPAVTVRFFLRRPDETPWCDDDVDGFVDEVALWRVD